MANVSIKCYFHGSILGNDLFSRDTGTVSFAIPDIGVIFRSRWVGSQLECQYAALLSLLKFIETNDKLFKDKNIEILSDASIVIYQLTKDKFVLKNIESYYKLVQTYKTKFPFKLRWSPQKDNPAHHGLIGTPPIKPDIKINYNIKNQKNMQLRGGVLPM